MQIPSGVPPLRRHSISSETQGETAAQKITNCVSHLHIVTRATDAVIAASRSVPESAARVAHLAESRL